jgi:virulence-associated protein VagC
MAELKVELRKERVMITEEGDILIISTVGRDNEKVLVESAE